MTTDSVSAPPSDSIFAVMEDSLPQLGMLVDRTSFDETDDFGINMDNNHLVGAPPVVMKDGRVRRRLRWRPKSMAKRRRNMAAASGVGISSNQSVVSNTSRQSRRSQHSFASTETAKLNNTSSNKQRSLKFPLPRPPPSSLPNNSKLSSIGNEGDFVQSKMLSNNTVFVGADAQPTKKQSSVKKSKRPNLPPLFQKRLRSPTDNSKGSTNTTDDDSIESVPQHLPALNGEDVEIQKRMDLRIRATPSSNSESNDNNPPESKDTTTALEEGVQQLSVSELRPQEDNHEDDNDVQEGNTSRMQVLKNTITDAFKRGKKDKQLSPAAQAELRFSMSDVPSTTPNNTATINTNTNTSSPKSLPVDTDTGAFLEAEKNLQAIHEMATIHLEQGEYAEALEVFEEILRGQLARYGEEHYRVGTALHNIGIVHMRQSHYAKAVEVYKEAVRVRKVALDSSHPDVAVSLAQLGVAYMESGKHRKAIGAFREALKIRRKCLGNEHPKVAKILNNIGCSLFELEELQVAQVAFEEALDIQRSLLKHPDVEGPVSEQALLSIASTQSNIASIKLYCGKYDAACVDLEEALLIQQCVLGDDHPLSKRTQESLAWMERSRHSDGTNFDLTRLISRKSVFESLYSGFDSACRGWENEPDLATTTTTE